MTDAQTNDQRTTTDDLADLKRRIKATRTALDSVRRKQLEKTRAERKA